ncbi:MAG: hypothetical protein IPM17_15800 [Verrucomicrobia bacterium]|jgi:hypothetical protein|nr:hypothetical protein [Verrucomicrobiota bacterium]
MIARFDLYDFVANLIPGLVFLWCVQTLAGLFGWTLPLDFTGGLSETSILIALGYITGLLLQGLSQGLVEQRILKPLWGAFPSDRWLLPDDEQFSATYKTRLLTLIRDRFGVSTDPDLPPDCPPDKSRQLRLKKNHELFYLVYHAVGGTNPRPLTFNAHYGLFRVLLTMFGLLSLVSLAGLVWALCRRPDARIAFALWSAIFVAATFIAYFRCKKRGEDFAQSVYALFMAIGGSKTASDKPA